MLTDTHPTETRVILNIPKDLLRDLGHLALNLDCHRNEVVVRLLREALAHRAREGEE